MNGVSAGAPNVPAKIAPVPVRETKKRPERLSNATPSGGPSAAGIVKIVVASALPRLPLPLPPAFAASATDPPAANAAIASSPAIPRHACLMMCDPLSMDRATPDRPLSRADVTVRGCQSAHQPAIRAGVKSAPTAGDAVPGAPYGDLRDGLSASDDFAPTLGYTCGEPDMTHRPRPPAEAEA